MTTPGPALPPRSPLVWALTTAVKLAPTGRKFLHRLILLRKNISEIEDAELPAGFESGWAGPTEIRFLNAHKEATSTGAYEKRAARGDSCVCLKKANEVIAYQWIAWRSGCLFCGFRAGYEILFLPLKAHQVFAYDTFVYSAHRRRGMIMLLRKRLLKELKERGITEIFGLVDPENVNALKSILSFGYEPLRMAYGVRIRQWGKVILGPANDAQLRAWIDDFKIRSGLNAQTDSRVGT